MGETSREHLGLGCTGTGNGNSLVSWGKEPLGTAPVLLVPPGSLEKGHGVGGLQAALVLGQACSCAWGDTGQGRSLVCCSRARGFAAETLGELNVRLLQASSTAGGRALGGLAGWGRRDPSLGGRGPCQGMGRADNTPPPPWAALLEQREPQIKVLWAEWGSAPGLAWADTSPKG